MTDTTTHAQARPAIIKRAAGDSLSSKVSTNFEGWSDSLRAEMIAARDNQQVGERILLETPDVRIWEIRLPPGARLPAHTHVRDYFWTATTPGRARSHFENGDTFEMAYQRGDTQHFTFEHGATMVHDLENIGGEELAFVTVEFLGQEPASTQKG